PNLAPGTRSAEVSLEGDKGTLAKSTFTLITLPQVSKVDPDSARAGSTVQVETNGSADGIEVFFGKQKANVVSQNQNTLSVQVPAVSENIPNSGLKVPLTLALQGIQGTQATDFTLIAGLRIQGINPSAATPGTEVRIAVDEVPKNVSVYF